jgi:putative DNA primase/helicase
VARGRWPEILLALGVGHHIINGKHQACPACGGKDRFRFTDFQKQGDYFCGRCGSGNGLKLLGLIHGWEWKQAAAEVDRVIGNLPPPRVDIGFSHSRAASPGGCRRLYAASRPINGDAAGKYLTNRGLSQSDFEGLDKVLRYVPAMRYQEDHTLHPGMIAVFSDAAGKPTTIHRTYLTGIGTKAALAPNRMFMAGTVPVGGAIRLSVPEENLSCMGIAEGIETALSARALRSGLPVWAAGNDQLLRQWKPPVEAIEITIFADNDKSYAGQSAAYALAARLVNESVRDNIQRRIIVDVPPQVGTDWNDILQQGGEL